MVVSFLFSMPVSAFSAVRFRARSIAIKPWDKSMFRVIEKAIIDSELGIMPENNGEIAFFQELRQKIIDELSCNPGHFGSSLGV